MNRAKVRANIANSWANEEEKVYLLGLIDADIATTPLREDETHEQ